MPQPPAPRPPTLADVTALPSALVAIARSRLALRTLEVADIAERNRHAAASHASPDRARLLAGRAAKIIPWLAARVPWRSDCLVQALAAQDWLAASGVPSRIEIGIDRKGDGIEPHAWLSTGDIIVVGGRIERFSLFL